MVESSSYAMGIVFCHYYSPGKTLNSGHFVYYYFFFFIPQPAEYGAEEFSLNAVPTLGSVRIGLGGGL